MHCTQSRATRTRLPQALAAAALSVALLAVPLAAHAQSQPPHPQARPQSQSPSPTISDQKLDAAAAAVGQVTTIRQSYEQKIAKAPPSDKQHMTDEANNALEKAVTDQGLSVDEYNSIMRMAQTDPTVRQKLAQRIHPSGQ